MLMALCTDTCVKMIAFPCPKNCDALHRPDFQIDLLKTYTSVIVVNKILTKEQLGNTHQNYGFLKLIHIEKFSKML